VFAIALRSYRLVEYVLPDKKKESTPSKKTNAIKTPAAKLTVKVKGK